MARNLRVTVDGHSYSVTVEELTANAETLYPPPGLSAEVVEAAAKPAPKPAPAAAAPAAAPVAAPASPAGANDVTSPMTGVLLDYTVKEGDTVAVNQQVATVEAMKMKTIVASQVAGKVTKLHVAPGSSVDSGQALVTIS